ncbi:hypothetical protein D3C72_106100 [compost metagenome]
MSNTQTEPGNKEQDDTANVASSQVSASDLNNATPTPPPDAQVRLRKNAEESDKLDNPERTNDSTIDPNKPKEDILKGFHGG